MPEANNNVSNEELNKFNDIANEWWDPDGPMKPLHQINPIRMDFIEKHAPLQNRSVLDVGCGAGLLSEALAQKGANVCAIDMAEQALECARMHMQLNELDIDYQNKTIEALSDEGVLFEVITCMEMIEHVPDPQSIISACTKALKPGGLLFLSTLNRNVKSYLMSIIGAEYVLRMLPVGTHEYKKFIKPSELCHMARINQLQLVELKGIHYNPLKSHFSASDDVSVNYMAAFKKPVE